MRVILLSLLVAGARSLTVVGNATHGSQEDTGVGPAAFWEKSADSLAAGVTAAPAFNASVASRQVPIVTPFAKEVWRYVYCFFAIIKGVVVRSTVVQPADPWCGSSGDVFQAPQTPAVQLPDQTVQVPAQPQKLLEPPALSSPESREMDAATQQQQIQKTQETLTQLDTQLKENAEKVQAQKLDDALKEHQQTEYLNSPAHQLEVINGQAQQQQDDAKRLQQDVTNIVLNQAANLQDMERREAEKKEEEMRKYKDQEEQNALAEQQRLLKLQQDHDAEKAASEKKEAELKELEGRKVIMDDDLEAQRLAKLPYLKCSQFKDMGCYFPEVAVKRATYKTDFKSECCRQHPWIEMEASDKDFPWVFNQGASRYELKPYYASYGNSECDWTATENALWDCVNAYTTTVIQTDSEDDRKLKAIAKSLTMLGRVVDFMFIKLVGSIPIQVVNYPKNLWAMAAAQSYKLSRNLLANARYWEGETGVNVNLIQALDINEKEANKCKNELLALQGFNEANKMTKPGFCDDYVTTSAANTIRIDIATLDNTD